MPESSNGGMAKWLLEGEPIRPGDVCINFNGGARLSVRPRLGCSKCGGSGRSTQPKAEFAVCHCIRSEWKLALESIEFHPQPVSVKFADFGDAERARILRIQGEMAQIQSEKEAIEVQAKERRERYLSLIEGQRGIVEKAREDLRATTARIEALEEARVLLEQQKSDLERELQENRASIMGEQNAAVRLSSTIGHELATIAESEAAAAAITAGKYGERYEKLGKALAKREVELVEAQKKVDALEPPPKVVEEVPQEQTDKNPQPQGDIDAIAAQG